MWKETAKNITILLILNLIVITTHETAHYLTAAHYNLQPELHGPELNKAMIASVTHQSGTTEQNRRVAIAGPWAEILLSLVFIAWYMIKPSQASAMALVTAVAWLFAFLLDCWPLGLWAGDCASVLTP